MTDSLISAKTAKLATEAGFKILSDRVYYEDGRVSQYLQGRQRLLYNRQFTPAVTQSLLHKWLRDTYDINLVVSKVYDFKSSSIEFKGWSVFVGTSDSLTSSEYNKVLSTKYYSCYEEATEAGLEVALEIIINRTK